MSPLWTFHGGRLSEARAFYGDAGGPWLDLSTGINPHGWPVDRLAAFDWHALPDVQGLADLEAVAARYFGVDPSHVCALPGTEIGLRLLGDLLPGRAVHVEPCYRTHAEIFPGSAAVTRHDLTTLSARNLVLANPNNPDGRIVSPATLEALLARLAASSGWLAVDEAFADTCPDISVARLVSDDRPLVLFRSFGKFFGLAGVRLGFVIAPRPLIARYRAKLGSWPISSAAIAIGTAALADARWISGMRRQLDAEAKALDTVLSRHGLTPIGECPLFRLIETQDAAALFDRLARQAILTRPFDHHPGWLRIGLPGSDAALARLDRALAHG